MKNENPDSSQPQPDSLEWTGERYVPDVAGEIRYEHMHRYSMCRDLVRDKRVLDIACGEGYGAACLGPQATSVIGMDLDADSIAHASNKYGHLSNVKFQQASVDDIPLEDSSIDVIISFETIEHLLCQEEMLAEFKRVLSSDGVLVISTPDKAIYSKSTNNHNEFHVKELFKTEFHDLLTPQFQNIDFYGQRFATGSFIYPTEDKSLAQSYRSWTVNPDHSIDSSIVNLPDPVYLIAICSDVNPPVLEPSIYSDDHDDLFQNHVAIAHWGATLNDENKSLVNGIGDLRSELDNTKQWGVDLDRERVSLLDEKTGWLAEVEILTNQRGTLLQEKSSLLLEVAGLQQQKHVVEQQRNAANLHVTQLLQSVSWKLSLPVRIVGKILRRVKRILVSRIVPLGWRVSKKIFNRLPLSLTHRIRIKNFLFKNSAGLLRGIPAYEAWALAKGRNRPATLTKNPEVLESTPKQPAFNVEDIAFLSSQLPGIVSLAPKASIIIPVYGEIAYTLMCLKSITTTRQLISFEIVVVDDDSPDNSKEVLNQIDGISLIPNEKNQGFIRSCNAGAEHAIGEYLVFLNNDTEVTDGWLDELIYTLESIHDAGLVGSKLVYPDGKLQEAGGIIWNDGSAWNYGRMSDPGLPEYNYLREVDYCSGASVALSNQLFSQLGGFDEHYLPAYGEDSDLAFKVRQAGKKVYYQPMSTVIHYEGVSSGTDVSSGVKSYQLENAVKLFERWKTEISTHPEPGHKPEHSKDRGIQSRILVLDHCTPTPDRDAGSITVLNILRLLLAQNYHVTFIAEDNYLYMPGYTTDLQKLGVEVLYAPYLASLPEYLKQSGSNFAAVMLFRPLVAERHLSNIKRYCANAKIIYHASDLHFLRKSREAELENSTKKRSEVNALLAQELDFFRNSDVVIVHSTVEAEMLESEYSVKNVHTFPWAIDVIGTNTEISDRNHICFVGGYQHPPNVDAAIYFIQEVFPKLKQRLPDVCFYAVGSSPTEELKQLQSEDIIVTDFVADISGFLNGIRVAVAPLRYGAGIKGKIGTTLSLGLPCVATEIAAEGMSLEHNSNILIADEPDDIVDEIVRLYTDEDLWNQLSTNGIEFAKKSFGFTRGLKIISEVLSSVDLTHLTGSPSADIVRKLPGSTFSHSSAENTAATTLEIEPEVPVESADPSDDEIYQQRRANEIEFFQNYDVVHDLPEIFHYWSHNYLGPKFSGLGIRGIYEFFADAIAASVAELGPAEQCKVVSIGSGNCDIELEIAKVLRGMNIERYVFECIDIVPDMLERGRQLTEQEGFIDNFSFTCADANSWQPARNSVNIVMANQSLHHIADLEILFDTIAIAIGNSGKFVTSDVIGRNGHMRWPEAMHYIDELWKEMPERYKCNLLLQRIEPEYENWDCSVEGFEGIRAQDILPLLLERFQFDLFLGYGNLVDIFVDRAFGHNFKMDKPEDIAFIDKVASLDEQLIEAGTLKPTHMMAIMSLNPEECRYYKNISPAFSVRDPKLP